MCSVHSAATWGWDVDFCTVRFASGSATTRVSLIVLTISTVNKAHDVPARRPCLLYVLPSLQSSIHAPAPGSYPCIEGLVCAVQCR